MRIAVISTVTAVSLVLLVGVVVVIGTAVRAFDDLGQSMGDLGSSIATGPVAEQPAASYDAEQLDNASTIMAAGRDLGLPLRDQAIAVMTAMGESSLRNIDYGDWETGGITNPDGSRTTSIGLFQQQDGWGSREQRLDPYTAATLFYRAMLRKVPDPERQQLQPTLVAHRTQINRDPQHYARYWPAAVGVVEQLSGERVADTTTP
ncbi:MAG: peptidase M23 [Microbacterium sp.]|uniref:peptidase M23 n=1 Tax=Microbacterium sp. TaxID=51671 RepID=UPI002611D77E|nr:peptidase M23 [Microbacterium sp.]MCX6501554.1 peptidase M23 [Microbacterium sp.]